jgi:hypothetical protein
MKNSVRAALLTCLVAIGPAHLGCTSISSTMLTRDETDQCWEKHPHLHGIPITLKVPTHVKMFVFDKHLLERVDHRDGSAEVLPVNLDVPIREFGHEFLYTEKIFTVDFKRPAAGSYNLRLDMNEQQYFSKIEHDVTDETISKVTGLISQLFPGGKMFDTVSNNVGAKPKFKEVKSLVAAGVFNIDAPDFEQQVASFLNCHLNKAHDAWVVPPDVNGFKRVGIPSCDNLDIPHPNMPFCTDAPILETPTLKAP